MAGYLDLDYEGLLGHMNGAQVGSQQYEMCKALLQIRLLESQAKAMQEQGRTSEALVASTDKLVKATEGLGSFTLALVAVTIALVVVTAIGIFAGKG